MSNADFGPAADKSAAAASHPAGTAYRPYEVVARLGRGGMADVFRARDVRHGRVVALKVMRSDVASALGAARFAREIATVAKLHHPHLLPILDSGDWDGLPFYVMPYVDGPQLRERLAREGRLPLDEVTRIAREVSDALEYVHANGVVHRDLKPENLLVSGGHTFVADFGIAASLTGDGTLTSSQIVLGTPNYVSPEQIAGGGAVDGRSDQYSLACVLYELVAGVPPFAASAAGGVVAARFAGSPVPVTTHRPAAPPHMADALARALAVDPGDRFPTMRAFADALCGQQAHSPALLPNLRVRARWQRWRPLAVAMTLSVLTGVGAVVWHLSTKHRRSAERPGTSASARRVVVLPFALGASDVALSEAAGSLREALLYELRDVEALTVVAPPSANCLTAAACDSLLSAAAVGSVVQATVNRSGRGVRVTVHLLNRLGAADVVTGVYEQPAEALIRTPRDLSVQLSTDLRRTIGRAERTRALGVDAAEPAARDLVMRADKLREDARTIAEGPDRRDVRTAVATLARADSLLDVAHRRDPRWVRPLVERGWLAQDLSRLQEERVRPATYRRGLGFADAALRLDHTSADALELRGTLRWGMVTLLTPYAPDTALMRLAELDLRRAVHLDPSQATAWSTLSFLQSVQGELAEAAVNARRALSRDVYLDNDRQLLNQLFNVELMLGRFGVARDVCRRGRRVYPDDWRFVQCELTLMRHDPAVRPSPGRAWKLVAVMDSLDAPEKAWASGRGYFVVYRRVVAATISARAGDHTRARAELEWARRQVADDPGLRLDLAYDEAVLRVGLGEVETARKLIRQLAEARLILRPQLLRDPLMRRTGLTEGLR